MLLKLLGELQDNLLISKSVSVSAPLDLEICANTLNQGSSKLYQTYLMKFLKNSLLQKYQQYPMQKYIGINEEEVKKLKTFWEFDDVYTAPINGFRTAKNYYDKASSKPYLKHIKTKTLIIQALDDPFMTPDIIPTKEELSDAITLEVYKNGGHVGFVSGTFFKANYWLEDRVMEFFIKAPY
jgi:predicted alpha/beta-fold hydrolase